MREKRDRAPGLVHRMHYGNFVAFSLTSLQLKYKLVYVRVCVYMCECMYGCVRFCVRGFLWQV